MMIPACVKRVVTFPCGCISEYPVVGEFSELKDWHIIPCARCAVNRVEGALEERAQRVWTQYVTRPAEVVEETFIGTETDLYWAG